MITDETERGFRLCICRDCFNYYLRSPVCEGSEMLYEAYGMLKNREEISLQALTPAGERYCYDEANAYEKEHILKLTAQRSRVRKNGREMITRLHFRRGEAYGKTAVSDGDCPYCGSDLRRYVSAKDRHEEETVIRASELYRKAVQKEYDRRKEAGTESDAVLRRIEEEQLQTAYAYRDDVRNGLGDRWTVYRITEDPAFCPYRKDQEE